MNQNGKMRICDRCGVQHFSPTTGEGEADGGFTRWNNFEEAPPLWGLYDVGFTTTADGRKNNTKIAELCTSCAREWQSVLERFMQNVEVL